MPVREFLIDWWFWFSSTRPEDWIVLGIGVLLLDAPRYGLTRLVVLLEDVAQRVRLRLFGTRQPEECFHHCPSVCVVLAGYNEATNLGVTVDSMWDSYPRLEIIIVDDGSSDGMADEGRRLATMYPGIRVLQKTVRGGKSSAANYALPYTRADVIIGVDPDSRLGTNAIWEIVQPFQDPEVGAVSGSIIVDNASTNLLTMLQAYEYCQSVFVARIAAERFGLVLLASGAFAAIRREAVEKVMGWDVGPPEDLDICLKIRKAGFKITHAPYAECITRVPTTLRTLVKQRTRWECGGVVRSCCRKHVDLASFWHKNFKLRNLIMVIDNWVFQLIINYVLMAYLVWLTVTRWATIGQLAVALYLFCVVFESFQILTMAYYSSNRRRDLGNSIVVLFMPFYLLLLNIVRTVANTREIFLRSSYRDNFVPKRVREVTWHW